jgi:alpha-tubulin suppressor-like RCC1 family protein
MWSCTHSDLHRLVIMIVVYLINFMLIDRGEVYSWGQGIFGALGIGNLND